MRGVVGHALNVGLEYMDKIKRSLQIGASGSTVQEVKVVNESWDPVYVILRGKMYKLIHRQRIIHPFGPFINAAGKVGNRFKVLVG